MKSRLTLQASVIFWLVLGLFSCKTPDVFSKREVSSLSKMVSSVSKETKAFSGWIIRDASSGKILFDANGDKYFTPASNTKILTLFVSDLLLPDTLPSIKYFYKNDTLIFRGFGDPTFLHEDFQYWQTTFQFLQSHNGPIKFDFSNFDESAYGKGWMWDDYPYAFQAEKAPLPMYQNCVRFEKDSFSSLEVFPPYFDDFLIVEQAAQKIYRLENGNLFFRPPVFEKDATLNKKIPFRWSPQLVQQMLEDTLQKQVMLQLSTVPDSFFQNTLYSTPKDTVLALMMQDSDNQIAEQLLLMCAEKQFGNQQTEKIIEWALDSLFKNAPQDIKWVDGSGISRYNLVTPETISYILFKLWNRMGPDRFLKIFPAGGVSGTIKDYYKSDTPYVFAKTGTLRYVHNLSGIVYTSSGKPLIFSFMHNNFPSGSIIMKREMEKMLEMIREMGN
ncbi:MAG: D-alanyl-D-alanine carboxypeptidase [Saprospiraceae bacterium]|nr:D-alanyl-D-alanine carboxypeptidase [Saprospiraceae bacterium]